MVRGNQDQCAFLKTDRLLHNIRHRAEDLAAFGWWDYGKTAGVPFVECRSNLAA